MRPKSVKSKERKPASRPTSNNQGARPDSEENAGRPQKKPGDAKRSPREG